MHPSFFVSTAFPLGSLARHSLTNGQIKISCHLPLWHPGLTAVIKLHLLAYETVRSRRALARFHSLLDYLFSTQGLGPRVPEAKGSDKRLQDLFSPSWRTVSLSPSHHLLAPALGCISAADLWWPLSGLGHPLRRRSAGSLRNAVPQTSPEWQNQQWVNGLRLLISSGYLPTPCHLFKTLKAFLL